MIQMIKMEHNVLNHKFEILKMASKMVINYAPKTFLTNTLDKNPFYVLFL